MLRVGAPTHPPEALSAISRGRAGRLNDPSRPRVWLPLVAVVEKPPVLVRPGQLELRVKDALLELRVKDALRPILDGAPDEPISRDEVVAVLEQLSWLGASIRPPAWAVKRLGAFDG